MIPVLVIAFQVPMPFAVGAVVTGLLPASLIATFFNLKERSVDPVTGLWLEVPTLVGVVGGAYLTAILPIQLLEFIFAAFVGLLGIQMLRAQPATPRKNIFFSWLNTRGPILKRERGGAAYQISAYSAIAFGLVAGAVAGVFGIGGGFLKTPIMIKVYRIPARVAVATALFMIVFTSLVSLVSHASLGHVLFELAFPISLGFSLGAMGGNLFKKHFNDSHTEKLIGGGLILAGLATAIYAAFI